MNLKSITQKAAKLAVGAALTTGFAATAVGSDWTYSNRVITEVGGAGLQLNATLSGTELTLTSVKSDGTELVIDLRGQVTDASSGADYTIVEVGSGFLRSKSNVSELYLPDTIRTIGNCAFYSCTIDKIEPFLPASVTTFTGQDFNGCTANGDLVLSNSGIASIPDSCFKNTKITSADLSGTSVTTLGDSCFRSCANLKRIVLPATFTSFANAGFMDAPIEEVVFNALIPSNYLNNNQWSGATSFKIRFVYDTSKGNWNDFIANETTFVSWDAAGANQQTYFDTFGSDADVPTGYFKITTNSKYAWLVKTTSVSSAVDLLVEGSPAAAADGGFAPAYGEYPAVQDNLPMDVTAPEHAYLNGTAYTCAGYSLQKYDTESEVWTELSSAATNALTFNETASGKYKVIWSWTPVAYKVNVSLPPELGEISMTKPDFDDAYYTDGTKVTLTATPANDVAFCWWRKNGVKSSDNPLSFVVGEVTEVACYLKKNWVVSGKTMSDGYWTLNISIDGSDVTVTDVATQPTNHGGMLDLRKPIEGGYVLVAVGASAFRDRGDERLTSLTLPDTIRTIGNAAFYRDYALTEVEPFFPKSLTYLGGQSFESAPVSNALVLCNPAFSTFDDDESSIFNSARFPSADFRGSALTSLGSSALRNNTVLTTVYFGERFAAFGDACVNGCSNLREFHFTGNPPTSVAGSVFNGVPLAGTDLAGVVVYPADNAAWEHLLATDTTVTTLTAAEKESFRTKFPRLAQAKRKFKLIGTTAYQYLSISRVPGTMLIFR